MHWMFIGIAAIAITFAFLGAQSVWVSVLAFTLKVVLMLAFLFALYLAIHHIFRRKP